MINPNKDREYIPAHVDTEVRYDDTGLQVKIGLVALALVGYGLYPIMEAFEKAREIVGGKAKR